MATDRPAFDTRAATALLRRLTMAELRALASVKAAGTLSAAADLLGVTQPTLSQHIRAIEVKLDMRLFDRHRRGIEPTAVGAIMLRFAVSLQSELGRAAEELSIVAREDRRPIRIGSMPIASGGLLALAIGQFAADTRNLTPVVMQEGPREALLEHLRHGRIDLFVGRLPPDAECAGFVQEQLFLETLTVIASSTHPLASRKRVTADVLQTERWVLPGEDSTFYQQIAQSLRGAGRPMPHGVVHVYAMHAIPAIVATSKLLGFLPSSLFTGHGVASTLRRLPMDMQWIPAPVGILVKKNSADDARLQPFLRALRAVAASARIATGR
jgi:DNA-binding transcriptional LysR family regulator